MSVKDERETTYQVDGYGAITAWTNDPSVMRLWKRRRWDVAVFGRRKGEPVSWSARMPEGSLTVRGPKRKPLGQSPLEILN